VLEAEGTRKKKDSGDVPYSHMKDHTNEESIICKPSGNFLLIFYEALPSSAEQARGENDLFLQAAQDGI
jgi:hypothetical protein